MLNDFGQNLRANDSLALDMNNMSGLSSITYCQERGTPFVMRVKSFNWADYFNQRALLIHWGRVYNRCHIFNHLVFTILYVGVRMCDHILVEHMCMHMSVCVCVCVCAISFTF